MPSPTILMILDGWGIASESDQNAISLANTPHYDELLKKYPSAMLECSGEAVGLPKGQQGNSEVGHLNLGAGRVVYQDLLRIDRDIESGDFFRNEPISTLMSEIACDHKALHLMGLLSDGGVHSHQNHLFALLDMAKQQGVETVYVHAFLDGRDVAPDSAIHYLHELEQYLLKIGIGKIASFCGRYYSMDRDNRWERIGQAYDLLVLGKGHTSETVQEAIVSSYEAKVYDEFVLPTVIVKDAKPIGTLQDGDGVIFYNFRSDRARELTHALSDPNFKEFSVEHRPKTKFLSMTQYEKGMDAYLSIAYPAEEYVNTLGHWLAKNDKRQIRIAETEKYAHVTFFFNGGIEEKNINEDRYLIPSPAVATYDLKPEMSAEMVADKVVDAISSLKYDFILVNFANPDMVGHTGILPAAIKAVEVIDQMIFKIMQTVLKYDASLLICADHGNCECMADENGKPVTSHTNNKVPFIVIDANTSAVNNGVLCDVAPTVLDIMNLVKPNEMTGSSLIKKI